MRQQLGYYKISFANLGRLAAFSAASGDSERTLVTQFVRGWIGRNRDYYLSVAIQDAEARGLSFVSWGQAICGNGLPGAKRLLCPISDPLPHAPLTGTLIQRRINYLNLTRQNVALLRLAQRYAFDRQTGKYLTLVEFVSRIVQEHLERNWDKLYAPQARAEDWDTWDEEARLVKQRLFEENVGCKTWEKHPTVDIIKLAERVPPRGKDQVRALELLKAGDHSQIKLLALANPGDSYLKALGYLGGVSKRPDAAATILQEAITNLAQEVAERWTEEACAEVASELLAEVN